MNISIKVIRVVLGIFMIASSCIAFVFSHSFSFHEVADFLEILPPIGFICIGILLIAMRNKPAREYSKKSFLLFAVFIFLAFGYILFSHFQDRQDIQEMKKTERMKNNFGN